MIFRSLLFVSMTLVLACETSLDEGPGESSASTAECLEPAPQGFASGRLSLRGACTDSASPSSNSLSIDGLDWRINADVSSTITLERCWITIDFEAFIEKEDWRYPIDPTDVTLSFCRASLVSEHGETQRVLDPILEELVFEDADLALDEPLPLSIDAPHNQRCSNPGPIFELEDFEGRYQARISVRRDFAHLLEFVSVDLALQVQHLSTTP